MKGLKLFLFTCFAIILSGVSVFAEDDVREMKIAVVWNPYTQNSDAPFGWNVGGNSNVPTTGNLEFDGDVWQWNPQNADAPEISLAQVKFFLSSLNPNAINNGIPVNGETLDTEDAPEYGYAPSNWGIPNVLVYRLDDGVTYKQIKEDFGEKPNAIVYIGAGATIEDTDDEIFDSLFWAAAEDEVGILLIGQNSLIDARNAEPDPNKRTTFPIMGVQKEFRFKGFGDGNYSEYGKGGDVIKEFNFLTDNDKSPWEVADTIVLYGNYDEGRPYRIYLVRGGKIVDTIYKASTEGAAPSNGWLRNDVVNPKPQIYHKYGEWSISAKAVEVIEVDNYESEMNYGFHHERDFWIGQLTDTINYDGKGYQPGGVYIIMGSPSLFLNGREVLKPGARLDGPNADIKDVDSYGLQVSNGKVTKDWILKVKNPDDSTKTDNIVVIHKGQEIGKIRHISAHAFYEALDWKGDADNWKEYSAGTRIATYNAGGLRDLRIAMQIPPLLKDGKKDSTNIYYKIFKTSEKYPNVNIDTVINFKPYGSGAGENGRIQAAASIWEFNNRINKNSTPPKSFSELKDGQKFEKGVYYADYLANQEAGRPGNHYAQFNRPINNAGDTLKTPNAKAYDTSGNYYRESELPATVSSRKPYYDDFKGKIFRQIAVVQHGAQRLGIIGYQPTYLKDANASRKILHDMILWIGYNQYQLRNPDIKVYTENGIIPANKAYIKTTEGPVIVEFDGSKMTDEMRNHAHTLKAELIYAGNTISKNAEITKGENGKVVINFNLQNDININTENFKDTTITVKAWADADENSIFSGSDTTLAVIYLKKLTTKPNIKDNDSTSTDDSLSVDYFWEKTGDVECGHVSVIIKDNATGQTLLDTILQRNEKIRFSHPSLQVEGKLDIITKAVAGDCGYIDSDPDTIPVINTLPKNALPLPKIQIVEEGKTTRIDANGQYILTTHDYVYITFNVGEIDSIAEKIKEVAPHNLKAELSYGSGSPKTKSETITADKITLKGENLEIRFKLSGDGRDIIIIPQNLNDTTITVKAWAEPGTAAEKYFTKSVTATAVLTLKKLQIAPDYIHDNEKRTLMPGITTQTRDIDTLIINGYWKDKDGDDVKDEDIIITVKDKTGKVVLQDTVKGNEKIPFNDLPDGNLTITIKAEKDGYVNSDSVVVTVENNPKKFKLNTPHILLNDRTDVTGKVYNGTDTKEKVYMYADEKYVYVVFKRDFVDPRMKNYDHKLNAKLEFYGNIVESSADILKEKTDSVEIRFDLSTLTQKNSSPNDTTITVNAVAVPGAQNPGWFDESDTAKAIITYRKLSVDIKGITDNGKTSSNDSLTINGYWHDKDTDDVKDENIIVTVKDKTGKIVLDTIVKGGDKIPFDKIKDDGTYEITIKAEHLKYRPSTETKITVIHDGTPPYIVEKGSDKSTGAVWKYGDYKDKITGERYPDTLIIIYSEPVIYPNSDNVNGVEVITLWNTNGTKSLITVKKLKAVKNTNGTETWTYEIIRVENGKEPVKGDSVNINWEKNVRDSLGNTVKENNKKVLLTIGNKPVNMEITVISGGKITTTGGGTTSLEDIIKPKTYNPIVDDVIKNGNGTIIIVTPGYNLDSNATEKGYEKLQAVILDPVGNMVAQTDNNGVSEHLGVVVSQVGKKNVLTAAWDNKNTIGRDVGAGTYVLIMEVKWKGNEQTFRERKLVPVPKKTKAVEK